MRFGKYKVKFGLKEMENTKGNGLNGQKIRNINESDAFPKWSFYLSRLDYGNIKCIRPQCTNILFIFIPDFAISTCINIY